MPNDDDISKVDQTSSFIHDLATPIATMELNSKVLAEYLPILLDHYRDSQATGIPHHIFEGLRNLPNSYLHEIDKCRMLSQTYFSFMSANKRLDSAKESEHETFKKILLVEDEEIHQQIVLKQLKNFFSVDLACSASSAIEALEGEIFDAVLLDLMLPDGKGEALLDQIIKVIPEETSLFVISNFPISDNNDQLLKRVKGFLSKPFRIDEFKKYTTID